MVLQKNDSFALENFEGPIDFLIYLIQREEINIYDVSIQVLLQQFIQRLNEWQEHHFDNGTEFIAMMAYLVWLKSKMLLPKEENLLPVEKIEDPHFEIIHHLIDYCRFKQAAKDLVKRQEQQSACFFRGVADTPEWKKPLGIDHISLDELSSLFKELVKKASQTKPKIEGEDWRVADKIRDIRLLLEEEAPFHLALLFSLERSRLELIVTFLAILELMKTGEMTIGKERETQTLFIYAKKTGYLDD